mmetsp:Transcript_15223/g.44811  ORF Transcript_15223/g.44811 Transcript_15223/m.44811 type:complete len:277 (-) Transcript_15223:825-1655(-)
MYQACAAPPARLRGSARAAAAAATDAATDGGGCFMCMLYTLPMAAALRCISSTTGSTGGCRCCCCCCCCDGATEAGWPYARTAPAPGISCGGSGACATRRGSCDAAADGAAVLGCIAGRRPTSASSSLPYEPAPPDGSPSYCAGGSLFLIIWKLRGTLIVSIICAWPCCCAGNAWCAGTGSSPILACTLGRVSSCSSVGRRAGSCCRHSLTMATSSGSADAGIGGNTPRVTLVRSSLMLRASNGTLSVSSSYSRQPTAHVSDWKPYGRFFQISGGM